MDDAYYSEHYFRKFLKKRSWLQQLFLDRIDRKEPLFSFLKQKKKEGSTLLDVGCGNGLFLRHAEKYFSCVGVDISKDALKIAEEFTDSTTLKQVSIYTLKKLKKRFDVVACFDTLEHVVELEAILDDMYDVLEDDGILALSFPNAGCVSRRWKWKDWFCFRDESHLHFYTLDEWEGLLKRHRFVPLRRWGSGLIDPPYTGFLPLVVENVLIKYPTQILSLWGFPLPDSWGETCFVLAVKNPGVLSEHYDKQMADYAKVR